MKASAEPRLAMTAQMAMAALFVLPILAWTGPPAAAAVPWIAASTAINLVTVTALLKAYEASGFGVAYPVVRAVSVLLVVPLSALLSGEKISVYGFGGVALIAASLLLLGVGQTGAHRLSRAAMGWIALAGVGTAAYVMCDAQGVRSSGSAIAYGSVVSITNAIAFAWRQKAFATPARDIIRHARGAIPIAMASVASYLLILWVWSFAPIAPAAALRDTSAVFALIIAVVWLKEPFTPLRIGAICLSAAAVPLLRLA